jgi:hypothetical protein
MNKQLVRRTAFSQPRRGYRFSADAVARAEFAQARAASVLTLFRLRCHSHPRVARSARYAVGVEPMELAIGAEQRRNFHRRTRST